MKKTTIVLTAALLCISLVGCAKKEVKSSSSAVSTKVPDAKTLVSKSFIDPIKDWSKYDNLIKEIKSETNYETRTKKMHEAEDILMSNFCVIPLYYYNDVYMQKSYVSGVYANAFATKFFMY